MIYAVQQWRARLRAGETPEPPAWMRAAATLSAPKALGFGLLLSAANPKTLFLAFGAATSIAASDPTTQQALIALASFVVLVSIGATTIVVLAATMGGRADGLLGRIDAWMIANQTAIVSKILPLIGVNLVGSAISALG